MRKLLLLLGALVAIGIADGLQIKPSGRKEESYPYSLDKCCNFAFRLYKTVARKFKGNFVVTPFSAFDSLSLLSYGAGGNTQKQIREVLSILPDSSNELSYYESLTKTLTDSKNSPLNFVQVLYFSDKVEVSRYFKDLLSRTFITKEESINYDNPDEAIAIINKYFEERIGERALFFSPVAFKPQPSDMFLRSSLKFSAKFLYPFNQRYTENRPFFRNRDDKQFIPTMYTRGKFRGIVIAPTNAYLNSFRVIEIPYKNSGYSLLIYYPLNSYKLDELEQRLDTLDLRPLFNSKQEDIELYLPKFTIQNEQRLRTALNEMGMIDAFDRRANFTDISNKPLRLDEIYMQSYFSINEYGTKVDASQELSGNPVATQYSYSIPLAIEVNRPFMFTLLKRKGDDFLCLFSGRVYDPTFY